MLTRRSFLALALGGTLTALRRASAAVETRRAAYTARVGILYGVLQFEVTGQIDETVDRDAGRYEFRLHGRGSGIENDVEGRGILRQGRWTPDRHRSRFAVYGRESSLDVTWDYERRTIAYRSRSETFFLRRIREVDDVVPMPEGVSVDDVASATLNFADRRWTPDPAGTFSTHVVRRRRGKREASDEVEAVYRAELVPFVLRVGPDLDTGRPTAAIDLTRFSSWALEGQPARITFSVDRRPETLTASLMLGTSVTVRIG
ncbi:MAG TPA: hypothetical protein VLD61_10150 [Methylomirabilota bacterium]|nr:hypothetical protein [Methylomirabilota bacterium]